MTETEKVIRKPMITIVEPKEAIDKLWGKQKVRESDTYRLMRYVLRVDHDGKVLLHNCVTGQLVVLDQEEADALEKLPMPYTPVMEQLVAEHYLVPETFDEHGQTVNLRNIMWKLTEARYPKEVTHYIILPTTACNARCWYCYEKGIEAVTMTEETANEVVDFIVRNSGGMRVFIWWIGGEPTLAANRIDQISQGLQARGIEYISDITTNGYLFDDDMVRRARELWHVRQVNISLDGMEANTKRIKAFQGIQDNPFERIMKNAEKLLDLSIAVALRMNYDPDNYLDFPKLLKEAKARFPKDSPFMVYPHHISREYTEGEKEHAQVWINEKNVELTHLACESGLFREKDSGLCFLHYELCGAANGRWFTIHPSGKLVCCGEQLSEDQFVGDVIDGITNEVLVRKWRQFADHEICRDCELFPFCCTAKNCSTVGMCYNKQRLVLRFTGSIVRQYNAAKTNSNAD